VYRAAILGVRGELEAAVCTIAEARGLAERFSPAGRVNALALFTGEQTSEHLDPEWSRLGELAVHLAVSREQIGWFGLVWAAFASHAFAAAGRDAEAAALLRHIVPGLRAAEPTDYAQNRAVSMAAAAVWDLGAPDLAAELLPCAQRLIDAGVGDWYMTSNELSAARLATVLGHCDEALAHFASARQKCAGRRQRPLGAVVDFDEAVARMRLRKPGAPRLLSAACEQFAEMGMDEWSRRAALCDMPERELPEGLTPREAEILRLVAHGRTNKEIASELVVSVHTVERHLQNAYRKLSLRNRADAAAYVLRHDL
jgi:DNA-binding CsgD family transcriptional regulator